MERSRSLVARLQDGIAVRLGLVPSHRAEAVRAMLRPRTGEGVGYWLQLMMATALGTLGLALDSTAVVIGAMLIAPLMKPIVELAMGLATGSGPLVFRSGVRSVASIAAVVAAATVISWLLPFHDITRELTARTAPSLIDLFVAAACALAAAYATMFTSSEMASTAAGTSIGISLVPPLCTLGYALSIGHWKMAIGAALLFTANVTGIITVAGVVFAIVGFGQVDIHAAEVETSVNLGGLASRIGTNWSKAARRLGVISRLLLPLLLLAAIFVPLRRAVGEMSRRSTMRQRLEDTLARSKLRVAQSAITLDAQGAIVRVVLVGDSQAAKTLDRDLRAILIESGETEPRLSVWAVPDATALGALATRLDELPPPIVAEPVKELASLTPAEVVDLVTKAWPRSGVGSVISTWLQAGMPPELHIVHLGPSLGEAGLELLRAALPRAGEVVIVEDALEVIEAPAAEASGWLSRVVPIVERGAGRPGVFICIVVPSPPVVPATLTAKRVIESTDIATVRELVQATFSTRPRVSISLGDHWAMHPQLAPCPVPDPAPAPE